MFFGGYSVHVQWNIQHSRKIGHNRTEICVVHNINRNNDRREHLSVIWTILTHHLSNRYKPIRISSLLFSFDIIVTSTNPIRSTIIFAALVIVKNCSQYVHIWADHSAILGQWNNCKLQFKQCTLCKQGFFIKTMKIILYTLQY